ncbi:coniferyl-alcohol dehydrogenase [Pseudomonas sp. NPDC090208]|uniref:coniferyl-alcohol dehydrogenase n=1 Tax=Pseudomonas sp. NPDC090208 TaxID=3364478 RepID=UPI0037F1C84C
MLSGKLIVVTGAASGIGAQTARELRAQGARVIGVDRYPVSEHVDEFFQADLSDPSSIDALIDALPNGVNGLCNIAGLPPTAPAEQVLKVNALGLKRLTLGMIERRLADGAAITHLASLVSIGWADAIDTIKAFEHVDFADVGAFCQAHAIVGARSYFFSKEYLLVWTYRNRWTWRDRGIRMNCISPGPVDTPILGDFIKTLGARAEEDMRVMDRPARPDDIAPVVAFLQSDGSAWLRGTNIAADGGMSSMLALAKHGLN